MQECTSREVLLQVQDHLMIFTTPHNDIHISYCTESIGEDACKLHNSIKLVHCSSERAQIWNIESLLIASDRSDRFSNKLHDTRKKLKKRPYMCRKWHLQAQDCEKPPLMS